MTLQPLKLLQRRQWMRSGCTLALLAVAAMAATAPVNLAGHIAASQAGRMLFDGRSAEEAELLPTEAQAMLAEAFRE
jgi:hypothetical protein